MGSREIHDILFRKSVNESQTKTPGLSLRQKHTDEVNSWRSIRTREKDNGDPRQFYNIEDGHNILHDGTMGLDRRVDVT